MSVQVNTFGPLEEVGVCTWRLPRTYKPGMRVDGLLFAHPDQLEAILADRAVEQVANVAFLPGIQGASLAMPDIHWGYGFCIGGVCATDPAEGGVISPGGVGYDINCGVRLLRSDLHLDDVQPHMKELVDALFRQIPTGPGREGRYHFDQPMLKRLMREGPRELIARDLATPRDISFTEAERRLQGAAPDRVSDRAITRGLNQCGTLGGGNHFLEVQVVERVEDPAAAAVMGLSEGMICVLIHSGSRGLGYQVCQDALKMLRDAPQRYGISLPDRQLACAPIDSEHGQAYLGAMRAAANFAWCNRQVLMAQTRHVFERVLGKPWQQLGLQLVYDVAHNIAKLEEHQVDSARKRGGPLWQHTSSPCARGHARRCPGCFRRCPTSPGGARSTDAGQVKVHEHWPEGRVATIEPEQGLGFIGTPDGRSIYFHRNSVLDDHFEDLDLGSRVSFVEEAGQKGGDRHVIGTHLGAELVPTWVR